MSQVYQLCPEVAVQYSKKNALNHISIRKGMSREMVNTWNEFTYVEVFFQYAIIEGAAHVPYIDFIEHVKLLAFNIVLRSSITARNPYHTTHNMHTTIWSTLYIQIWFRQLVWTRLHWFTHPNAYAYVYIYCVVWFCWSYLHNFHTHMQDDDLVG